MTDKISELKSDIAELEALQQQATRPKVKDVLCLQIRKLVSDVIKLEEEKRKSLEPAELQGQPAITPSLNVKKCYQVKLNNYAWDQSNKCIKFYVTLSNVHTLPSENITCTFTNKSMELSVKNLDNKDYILFINKLLYDIVPDTSTWKIKTDMVVITAAKLESKTWSHVTEHEKKASDVKKMVPETDKSGDPSENLMSVMKNMYMQGDDEMKRTIAKAWTESQSKGPAF